MAHESLLYAVYGVGLLYLSLNRSKLKGLHSLRGAWGWYIAAMFLVFFFTLLRAGNWKDRELALVEFWSQGFSWLFVAISLCFLSATLLRDDLPNHPPDSPQASTHTDSGA